MSGLTAKEVAAAARYLTKAQRDWNAQPVTPADDKLPEITRPGARFVPPTRPGTGPRKRFAAH